MRVQLLILVSFMLMSLQSAHALVLVQGNVMQNIADDAYVYGKVITVAGDVQGDLVVAGGVVTVTGDVFGDLLVLGGVVNINGAVGDDLRAFGGVIRSSARTGGDFVGVGMQVFVLDEARIEGNFVGMGSSVFLSGIVDANATILADTFDFGGSIAQNALINASTFTNQGTVSGQTLFTPADSRSYDVNQPELFSTALAALILGRVLSALFWALGVFVLGWLLLKYAPNIMNNAPKHMREKPVFHAFRGFFLVIGIPLILILLALTIIGLPITKAGLLVYGIVFMLVGPVYSIAFGNWVYQRNGKKKTAPEQKLLVGVAIITIIRLIPFVGVTFRFVLFVIAFSALVQTLHEVYENARKAKAI
ncbi:hypothetical protein COT72_05575 [archaeon CG10_big_fil_rev_8_21_14_0_10_43_11]|nr:MAG: hypothetical protein COT72_05575 [archaeon CG10_big_fil_rev_8_21_14_0_10_43_11]